MNSFKVFPIGIIENNEKAVRIVLDSHYAEGLKGLENFSHVQILWWADGCDNPKDRSTLTEQKPYIKGPEELGVFALRSPERPNPIVVSNADIARVDAESGGVLLYGVDAFDGTNVIDLKPYTPNIDRVDHPLTPDWCSHWPRSYEESADFDWTSEFNF